MRNSGWGLLLVLNLAGCAAMSEAECRSGDWYGVGERDGRAGRGSRLGDYAEACEKAGVLPDTAEYANGRERGLRAYCTPENGYRAGVEGQSYQNVCAPEVQAAFLREYERGRERFEFRRDLDTLRREVDWRAREIVRLNGLLARPGKDEDRRRWLRERDAHERDRRDAQMRLLLMQSRAGQFED